MNLKKIIPPIGIFLGVCLIIFLAVWVRSSTLNSPTVLDYDPFWFYRHAQEIEDNNLKVPKWDELSYYPPGRPQQPFQGWSYTIVFFHKFLQMIIPSTTLKTAAMLSPLLMVGLVVIPAFFLGRMFSNSIGGLAAAFFLVLTPTFIGISMAGYCDSDAPVVFHAVFSIFLTILAVKQSQKHLIKSIPFIILAIFSNLLFVYNWGGGWITLLFFTALIPGLIIFRILEEMIHNKKLRVSLEPIKTESKPIFISLLSILIVTNIVGFYLWHTSVLHSLLGGLAFTGLAGTLMQFGVIALLGFIGFIVGFVLFKKLGTVICTLLGLALGVWFIFFSNVATEPLLVNISVAELQTLKVFSQQGIMAVVSRVGVLPFILTIFLIPLMFYKIYKKEKISHMEIFLFMWALVSIFLITRGIRFSLLFSISTAIISGYVIGNLFTYLRSRSVVVFSIIFGVIALFSFYFLSDAIQVGLSNEGMLLSQNWYNALDWLKQNGDKNTLVATWWDPGHIIAGYTGLKVHADGAHCDVNDCIPYNHNIRIRDMGTILSTTDENESISVLKKYVQLTPEQCQAARKEWGQFMSSDACDPIKTVYMIASSDLIQKYYWLTYFGSYNETTKTGTGTGFQYIPFKAMDASGFPTYGSDQIPYVVTLTEKDNQIIGILNSPYYGIRNAFIREIVYYNGNQQIRAVYNGTATENVIDGLLWVDTSFQIVIFMEANVRDSVFTKMFFWNGDDLKNFELVYSNQEVKIFKVKF